MRTIVFAAAIGCAFAAQTGAMAQNRGNSTPAPRSNIGNPDDLPPSVPPPVSTLSPTRGVSGPRLERGAVLCQTGEDLRRRAEVNSRRADGQADPGNPLEGCRLMTQQRGVEVVARHGLGRTEVKLKPSGEAGWTDAYLP